MTTPYVCNRCRQKLAASPKLLGPRLRKNCLDQEFRVPATILRSLHTTRRLNATQPNTFRSGEPKRNGLSSASANSAVSEELPSTAQMQRVLRERAGQPRQLSLIQKLAQLLRKRASTATETYAAYGACEQLVKECSRQADYMIAKADKNIDLPKTKAGEDLGQGDGWWYSHLGLTPTFNTWAQVTFLHMYGLTCRFRMLPPELSPVWHQHISNHFFYKAEESMTTKHAIVASSVRSRYLKDLFLQWRGVTAAYDEGMIKGDAVLATAIWRNLFKADDEVDFVKVGEVVSYFRAMLRGLESVTNGDLESAAVIFNAPNAGKSVVTIKKLNPVSLRDEEDAGEKARASQGQL